VLIQMSLLNVKIETTPVGQIWSVSGYDRALNHGAFQTPAPAFARGEFD
jgi:hypothetical protein